MTNSKQFRLGVGVYCDYAATTPVAPEVMAAMRPYFSIKFGNAGSLHSFGQDASRAVFLAREQIAHALGCNYKEIIFTGSATEANNLALRGVIKNVSRFKFHVSRFKPRVIISAIEHGSVLETARDLERDGVDVVYLQVTREGIVDLEKLRAALNDRTVFVSIMYANNEIGTIQPIREISAMIRAFRSLHDVSGQSSVVSRELPFFHVDAVQAFQYLPCRVDELGVDLMTLSAHKIYGPKGIGLLYARALTPNTYPLKPILTGGHQERGMRAGTENVPYVVGFAKAVELVEKHRVKESARVLKLRDYFWTKLKKIVPSVKLNGSFVNRLPNNCNVYFPGSPANELLIALDVAGVAASPGSACQAHVAEESYTIKALGGANDRASSSVRFTFGRGTTKKEIESILKVIKEIIARGK